MSNLLETVDTVIELLESGCPVDVFYFDFCKAFDSVPHYRLLTKLENYGIKGNTLRIISDFLTGRSLRTCVMHLDYNYNPNNEFKLDGIILESIVTEKDLGLTVSHDLKWDSNIKLCIKL